MYVLETDGQKRKQKVKKKGIGLYRCKLGDNESLYHDILDDLQFVSVRAAIETEGFFPLFLSSLDESHP